MNESVNRNSKKISALVLSTAAVVLTLIFLRLAAMANMQLIPFAAIRIASDLTWQIPAIPRWLDIVMIAMIWASIIALMKNQEDEELASAALVFSAFDFFSVLLDGLRLHGGTLFAGIIEGTVSAIATMLLSCILRIVFNIKFPRAQSIMIVTVGYIVGLNFVYALFHGVIFGVLSMLVTSAVALAVIAFMSLVSSPLISPKTPIKETVEEIAE
jgi:hypothetical protein